MRFPVRGSGGVRQPLPDLSAFGIEAGRAAAVANNSSPVTTQSNGTPSDRRPLSFSNAFVLDAKGKKKIKALRMAWISYKTLWLFILITASSLYSRFRS